MVKTENFEKIEITSAEELRQWLRAHHDQEQSVWLVTYKKSEPHRYVSLWEVLDELIGFGWIDGIRRKLDNKRTMQLISPRRVEHWAGSYKERAAKLIQEGRMAEAGFKSISQSKAAGLWNFMDDVDNLIVPLDLEEALGKQKGATAFFKSINDSSKRFAMRWIKLAKTTETRNKRIARLAALSYKQEKLPGS